MLLYEKMVKPPDERRPIKSNRPGAGKKPRNLELHLYNIYNAHFLYFITLWLIDKFRIMCYLSISSL